MLKHLIGHYVVLHEGNYIVILLQMTHFTLHIVNPLTE